MLVEYGGRQVTELGRHLELDENTCGRWLRQINFGDVSKRRVHFTINSAVRSSVRFFHKVGSGLKRLNLSANQTANRTAIWVDRSWHSWRHGDTRHIKETQLYGICPTSDIISCQCFAQLVKQTDLTMLGDNVHQIDYPRPMYLLQSLTGQSQFLCKSSHLLSRSNVRPYQ